MKRQDIELELVSDEGEVSILREDQLASVSDAELRRFGISRANLQRCFEEGVEDMQKISASDGMRPCAERENGRWSVRLVPTRPRR
jgi:hypothetical protein